ncbi:Aspartic peptidase [Gossypium australe]|uniref:Aspartic peptidase n=1 Tax=Gossypium australe TaxID=47621 RepID=A0A5B6WP76_9ROSI|nr:Aspartic peptidase [Gossypium australe]
MKKQIPTENKENDKEIEVVTPLRNENKPPILYPAKLKKERIDAQYAISQMPKYAKFLKELLANKRKLEEVSTVELNEEYSAILQNKLLTKLKDPGSFTVTSGI